MYHRRTKQSKLKKRSSNQHLKFQLIIQTYVKLIIMEQMISNNGNKKISKIGNNIKINKIKLRWKKKFKKK